MYSCKYSPLLKIILTCLLSATFLSMNSIATEALQFHRGFNHFVRHHVPQGILKWKLAIEDTGTLPVKQKFHFYIGNEAADADSIVSALSYSYFSYSQYSAASAAPGAPVDKTEVEYYLPLVSVPRSELHLRRDVEMLLREVDMNLSQLVCIDECGVRSSSGTGGDINMDITLLDHNSLSPVARGALLGTRGSSSDRGIIKEILDHHRDGGDHLTDCSGTQRNVAFDVITSKALVGSACTLVYEKYAQMHQMAKATPSPQLLAMEQPIAVLLMGVIALDTLNMSPAAHKGTERDGVALRALEALFPPPQVRPLDDLFHMLVNAKTDIRFWRELSAQDCMRLDQKMFVQTAGGGSGGRQHQHRISMSSVLLSASEMLQSKADGLGAVLRAQLYANTTDGTAAAVDIVAIMSMVRDPVTGVTERQLLLATRDIVRLQSVVSYLTDIDGIVKRGSVNLDLRHLETKVLLPAVDDAAACAGVEAIHVALFSQGNLACSRKQVAPELQGYFRDVEI